MQIRVLQIVTKMDRAGLETTLMNYYRNIDREKVQFDFLVHRSERGTYDDEIEMLGGRIYKTYPISICNFFMYLKWLGEFFKKHNEFRIVHSHLDSLSTFALWQAKKNGVPTRIAHSHTNSFDYDNKLSFRMISKEMLKYVSTEFFACSEAAGRFMFGSKKKITIMNNAIDSDKFTFDIEKRNMARRMLEISEIDFVIGHIGRFSKVKNHRFLIAIFEELLKAEKNAKLVLVGKGEIEQSIKTVVSQKGLENKICFTGECSEIETIMNAFDVFVLPSLFEGLGIVLIEAQANGLHCFASDNVSKESAVTANIEYLSLNLPATEWAKKINVHKYYKRVSPIQEIKNANYDIHTNAKWLERYYLDTQLSERGQYE